MRAFPVERVTSDSLRKALKGTARPDVRLITDELRAYGRMDHENHDTVNHSRGEYVRDDVHTNTVEGFFSLLKRGINGTFHHVSKGHLHRYCAEFEFRYNNRSALGVNDGQRAATLLRSAEGKRLTYKQPAGPVEN